MGEMARARGATVCAMDNRYCIDNGAMIAQAGIFAYQMGKEYSMEDCTCTQRFVVSVDVLLDFYYNILNRFRTDAMEIIWRP